MHSVVLHFLLIYIFSLLLWSSTFSHLFCFDCDCCYSWLSSYVIVWWLDYSGELLWALAMLKFQI